MFSGRRIENTKEGGNRQTGKKVLKKIEIVAFENLLS